MADITPRDLVAIFAAMTAAIEADRDRLCVLDGVIGDADHGITMATGFKAVSDALGQAEPADPTAVFNAAAKSFLNAVGASSGPLYATAFMRAGAAVKGMDALDRDTLVAALSAMARGIQERGKAQRGDKTMLDAWLPAADAAEAAAERNLTLRACVEAAASAAEAGAENTKGLVASKGRASRLGERAVGHMDPGAASAATLLRALARSPVLD